MRERYVSPHELPDGLDRELMVVLGEECAEVTIALSKAQRFGLADGYPGTNRTNQRDIGEEIGDLLEVVRRLLERGVICQSDIDAGQARKRLKLERFLRFIDPPTRRSERAGRWGVSDQSLEEFAASRAMDTRRELVSELNDFRAVLGQRPVSARRDSRAMLITKIYAAHIALKARAAA